MIKSIYFALLLFASLFSTIYGQEVQVELNKSTVGHNESFSVIFSSPKAVNGNPDFSPLQENFEIISCSQSHQISVVNGTFEKNYAWHLVLMPKTDGSKEIPSITFGSLKSPVKKIEVVKGRAGTEDHSIIVETLLDPKHSAYAQTQLIYTVRFFQAIHVLQGALSEVTLNDPDAMIEKLGADNEYEFYHNNGTHYHVVERKYAVFPHKTGELIFSPIVFSGRVSERGGSPFNLHSQFKRVDSIEHKIDIKPIPAPFQKTDWLGSNEVKLTEEWSGDPNNAAPKEPITWTVTVSAEGCMGNQIPPINLDLPSGLKHYLDKPQVSEQNTFDGITGIRQVKVALIPSAAGDFQLPEVAVKWWDLKADQLRETKLPARILQVRGSTPIQPSEDQIAEASENPVQMKVRENSADLPLWAWILIGLNGIWIGGLGYWLARKIPLRWPKKIFKAKKEPPLRIACKANDPKQAEAALLAWAQSFPTDAKPQNLMEIKGHLAGQLADEIDRLYQTLYGYAQKGSWDGHALWEVFIAYKPAKESAKTNDQSKLLRDLYPEV